MRSISRSTAFAKLARRSSTLGDFNAWQANRAGDAPHEYLVRHGFVIVDADTRLNVNYPTINHSRTTLSAKRIRLDYVMVKGIKRAVRYENVMKRVDSSRPSDHNLVVSDVVFLSPSLSKRGVALRRAQGHAPRSGRMHLGRGACTSALARCLRSAAEGRPPRDECR